MSRVLTILVAALLLIAATPAEVIPSLETNGYYIEPGAAVTEQVVSDAVSDGRNEGGRLYIVVLAEEPPGGATTFSDSALDLLGGDGYVVTVSPETVGFAGEGAAWSADQMNDAIDVSLGGGSDDEVVELFITALTGEQTGGDQPAAGGGGLPLGWIILIGGGAFLAWWYFSNRRRSAQSAAGRLAEVKELAKTKLDDVANDILEMEDEVSASDNDEVKEHYQKASAMYARAMEDTEKAGTVPEMMEVSGELDQAIWELDCAEALLDGKPLPPKPEPPEPESVVPSATPEGDGSAPPVPGSVPPPPPQDFDRRPQRRSGGSNEVMTMLMTMMAMGGMRGRRGGGFGGMFGGGGSSGPHMGGGGGGRFRGGGRRRG